MPNNFKYEYPILSDKDFGCLRFSGPGLSNCMFFVSRAYVAARKNGTSMLAPTRRKFSIGPWLRHEKDKRVYNKLFEDSISAGDSVKFIGGLKKIALIIASKCGSCKVRKHHGLQGVFFRL